MNRTIQKIRHDAKALSPVVASIILIAVTVAVSIAVAAWMGGMTIGFMGSSSVTVTSVDFNTNSTLTANLKNTGTKAVTIVSVKVNNQATTITAQGANNTLTLNAGDNLKVNIAGTPAVWVNGNTYKIDLYDPNNQVVGATQQNAPGA
jgi:archaeal type IV pilus assembly protein PilA